MTVKQFFKSTAFKCIAVLLGIVLVCGIFLTAMNTLLFVSDQEKLDRAIAKIYGGGAKVTEQKIEDDVKVNNADIVSVYKVEDGNYLVKSTGKGGFSGGSVTCWVVVKMGKVSGKDAITGVGKVVLDSYTAQTYMDKVSAANLYGKYATATYSDDLVFSTDDSKYKVSGASMSSNAINNAVNGAISYIKGAVLGVSTEDPTIYDDFLYTDYINKKETTHTVKANGNIEYHVVTSNGNELIPNNGKIDIEIDTTSTIVSFNITVDASTEYGDYNVAFAPYKTAYSTYMVGKTLTDLEALFGGNTIAWGSLTGKDCGDGLVISAATQSNFQVIYAAMFATANYDNAIQAAYQYTKYVDNATATVNGDNVTFTITTNSKQEMIPTGFVISVTVNNSGAITAFDITTDGSTDYEDYTTKFAPYKAAYSTYMTGKTLTDLEALFGDNDIAWNTLTGKDCGDGLIISAATQSNFQVIYAALYATANYNLAKLAQGGNN